MPLAIVAGVAFLALEIAAIAWVLHWLVAGAVSLVVVTIVIGIALTVTVFAWALVAAQDRADDEMEN